MKIYKKVHIFDLSYIRLWKSLEHRLMTLLVVDFELTWEVYRAKKFIKYNYIRIKCFT